MSIRTAVAVAALIAASAVTADAQTVTFTEIRDAVPLRYFNAETTAAQPDAPNTLVIGFHETDPFRASAEVANLTGTPLATDTLTVLVNAPAGYYVASVTCRLSGRGAVNTPADARAAANWVVDGQPADLGSFGGVQFPDTGAGWSLSQTIPLADTGRTTVPISLTPQLFAFAAPSLASAEVDLTSATIVVTVAPSTLSPRH